MIDSARRDRDIHTRYFPKDVTIQMPLRCPRDIFVTAPGYLRYVGAVRGNYRAFRRIHVRAHVCRSCVISGFIDREMSEQFVGSHKCDCDTRCHNVSGRALLFSLSCAHDTDFVRHINISTACIHLERISGIPSDQNYVYRCIFQSEIMIVMQCT